MVKMNLPLPSPYELTARLRPALLTVLPGFILAAVWLPEVWTMLGGLSTLLGVCGVTYLLAQLARHRGKKLEARFVEVGPELTKTLLRHADEQIDPLTKRRYHTLLTVQHGLEIPSPDEEAADVHAADLRYGACVTYLREATRDERKFKLLLQENTAYGFRRNLLALKPIAVPLLIVALVVNAAAIAFHWGSLSTKTTTAMVVELALVGALAMWIFVVTREFLAAASLAYGRRLLAACDQLAAKPAKASRAKVGRNAAA